MMPAQAPGAAGPAYQPLADLSGDHDVLIRVLRSFDPKPQTGILATASRALSSFGASAGSAANPRASEAAGTVHHHHHHHSSTPPGNVVIVQTGATATATASAAAPAAGGQADANKREGMLALVAFIVGIGAAVLLGLSGTGRKKAAAALQDVNQLVTIPEGSAPGTAATLNSGLHTHKYQNCTRCLQVVEYSGHQSEDRLWSLRGRIDMILPIIFRIRTSAYEKVCLYERGMQLLAGASIATFIGAFAAIPWLATAGVISGFLTLMFGAYKIAYHWGDQTTLSPAEEQNRKQALQALDPQPASDDLDTGAVGGDADDGASSDSSHSRAPSLHGHMAPPPPYSGPGPDSAAAGATDASSRLLFPPRPLAFNPSAPPPVGSA